MTQAGVETTIPVFELSRTVHASDNLFYAIEYIFVQMCVSVGVSESETESIWDLNISMEESYFWEPDSRLDSQEIANRLWKFIDLTTQWTQSWAVRTQTY
jgi:hypothetical protein